MKKPSLNPSRGKILSLGTSFFRALKIWLGILLVCCVLLTAVSAIPDGSIDQNIRKSSAKFSEEGVYPGFTYSAPNAQFNQLDNWTEASLLHMIFTGTSAHPLQAAFAQKQRNVPESDDTGTGVDSLAYAVEHPSESAGDYHSRPSYWLGMRVFLVPLLAFVDYFRIRPVLFAFNMLVLMCLAMFVGKKLNLRSGVALCASALIAGFQVSAMQWCNGFLCIWICAAAIAYILSRNEAPNCFELFMIIGMLTCYLDWFSVPLITFGIPAIIVVLRRAKDSPDSRFIDYFADVFHCGLGWCVGYASMLLARVALSALVGGREALDYFFGRVGYNIASTSEGESGLTGVLGTIVAAFRGLFPLVCIIRKQYTAVALAAALAAFTLVAWLLRRRRPQAIVLWLISLAPFAWIIVFNGYCRVHFWIAYRTLSITVFAWLCLLMLGLGCLRDGKARAASPAARDSK